MSQQRTATITRIDLAGGGLTQDEVARNLRRMKAARAMHAALLVARECIEQDRVCLADAHMDPVTNEVDDDGAQGVAEYDAVLGVIDAALAAAGEVR